MTHEQDGFKWKAHLEVAKWDDSADVGAPDLLGAVRAGVVPGPGIGH